ncbi:MAG: TauD/TfdA family dioxygenase [Gammaproteobacteria bacterium]|nr:TauD/TfdA family dioxygenase [Gammaproteobacteria bacterium]
MSYKRIEVQPVSGALGAEVSGVDPSQPLDEAVLAEIQSAWLEHLVLFFRDLDLSPAQFKAFAKLFGDIEIHPFIRSRVEDEPEIESLELAETPPLAPPTSVLHIDLSSAEIPTKGTVLYAVDVPEAGGDTIWVNCYAAFEGLSEPMQEFVMGLKGLFPALDVAALDRLIRGGQTAMDVAARFKQEPTEHPLVRTHPETGRKALFIDPLRMWCITNLDGDESRAISSFLNDHISKPEFQCRFHWRPGSLAVWDNRCTMHKRVDDVVEGRRLMHRVPLAGTDRPAI